MTKILLLDNNSKESVAILSKDEMAEFGKALRQLILQKPTAPGPYPQGIQRFSCVLGAPNAG